MKTLALFGLLSLSVLAQAGPGEKIADFKFGKTFMNGDGRETLADYLGSPVLIDFWGTK